MLHGLGDSGDGWASVGVEWAPGMEHVKFMFPHAPNVREPMTSTQVCCFSYVTCCLLASINCLLSCANACKAGLLCTWQPPQLHAVRLS
jgi:hypothetical protein